ncbi:MAG: methylenetetrahydrofolate reductase [Deltaproteobacteria bacterium]|nr:methylenetetrahydrofolate reductase [Deltaproteobacteria bacterium]MBW1952305.1 methylenetetrahydrofolate reductase [Deltaproteobacteria bacterium]MBW1985999.1 methylenetetrahydrofolate reductase [Deltaproteobacteria bacterium]MBW2134839.1 methylenetetrahydrofolate reductase [Deltaproteobacteria bacterium]
MKTESKLEKILESGQLAVTSEAGPPRGAEPEVIRKKGEMLKKFVDCCNVTDNQTAMVRVCSLASCIILKELGISPILQMTARDRNRLAIQADILGAYAFGINTMLCLTGDHQSFGDHPTAANVFDLDSIQMIQGVHKIREEGTFMGGAKMTVAPKMYIGAAANPFADPFELRVMRLAKKVAAGVDFIQTQCIFNLDKFAKWMQMVCDEGLDQKVHILAGITPMKGLGMARYMKNKVPGMDVPDEVINRLKGVPKEKQADEGITMAVEQIQQLKEMKGVHGFHIMAIEWEEKVPEIVERAGLLPRPQVD